MRASIVTLLLLPVFATTADAPLADLVAADAVCVVLFFRVALFSSLINFIVRFQILFIHPVQFQTNETVMPRSTPPVSPSKQPAFPMWRTPRLEGSDSSRLDFVR